MNKIIFVTESNWKSMEKKFKADNGLGNIFWGMAAVMLLALFIYRFTQGEEVWSSLIYFSFTLVFMLSTTIREYAVTKLNFLEIRMVLKLFSKNRRIAIGDMVALKKVKKNQLRIDKVRGFEVLRLRESDIDALIAELKERNPRIIVAGENDEQQKP
ncbi:MAG: hypothetical protein JJE08_08655 [Proteiniphilum sp.]|nr:hypothetical protein [Proteiniphilum sp.]